MKKKYRKKYAKKHEISQCNFSKFFKKMSCFDNAIKYQRIKEKKSRVSKNTEIGIGIGIHENHRSVFRYSSVVFK
jgi:flagellin-specific chaperone FliS